MKLKGKYIKIISDNENYTEWLNRKLIITYVSNKGNGYDDAMYPELLCDMQDAETGEECPFALYECEFEVL